MNTAIIQKKVGKSWNIIQNMPFYQLFDLGASQFGGQMDNIIDNYNNSLGSGTTITDSKGRTRTYRPVGSISPIQEKVAQIILALAQIQMEDLRKSTPYAYRNRLQDDFFVVTTNRGILKSMMRGRRSINSIGNDISKLMKAGIIAKKESTSSRREVVDNEDGTKTIIYRICQNGRGDFRLYIPKALFVPKIGFAAQNLKSQVNTKEKSNQIQNLEQSNDNSFNKDIIKSNNPKVNLEGGLTAMNPVINKGIDTESMLIIHTSAAAAGKITENSAADKANKAHTSAQRVAKNREVMKKMAKDGPDRMAQFLYFQILHLLYPTYNRVWMQKQQNAIEQLFILHIDRFMDQGMSEKQAFYYISRGIILAHNYKTKHPEFRFRNPLQYLRIDDHHPTNTLKIVLDTWVKEEAWKANMWAKSKSKLITWQYSHRYSQKMFDLFIEKVNDNYSQAKEFIPVASRNIENYLSRLGVENKSSITKKAVDAFKKRCEAIINEL